VFNVVIEISYLYVYSI